MSVTEINDPSPLARDLELIVSLFGNRVESVEVEVRTGDVMHRVTYRFSEIRGS